jgi:hypothetical protein
MSRVHEDGMQARYSQLVTSPKLEQRDKVSVVIKDLFIRGQLNRKLNDIQLGPFLVLEKIVASGYKLELPYVVRLNPVFHVNDLFHVLPLPYVLLSMLRLVKTMIMSMTLIAFQRLRSIMFQDAEENTWCSTPISRTGIFHMFGID